MQMVPGNDAVTSGGSTEPEPPAILLSIAGFDPSSGAGFTADLKVFAVFGFFGVACPTALTVQSTQGVRRSQAVDSTLVSETLACLADDMPIAGVKIGMLAEVSVVEAVADWLSGYLLQFPETPVVLDPVLRSSSGRALLGEDALRAVLDELIPYATVVTPNRDEATALSKTDMDDGQADVADAASQILRRMTGRGGAASRGVVVTGGDGSEATVDDYLLLAGAAHGEWISGPRVATRATHGTGCAFSSALLCALVSGAPLATATRSAKAYVHDALAAAYPIGKGRGPMHHLFGLETRTGGRR